MLLFLDIDGTVVDHRTRSYGLYEQFAVARNLRTLGREAYFERKARAEDERSIVAETFPPNLVEPYLSWKRAHIESDEALRMDVLVGGMEEALEALAAECCLAALSARQTQAALIAQLSRLGIWEQFDASLPVGPGSPSDAKATAIVSYLAELAEPTKSVVIGDTEIEIAAAARAGIACISVAWGLRSAAYLRSEGAARVLDRPDQLLDGIRELR